MVASRVMPALFTMTCTDPNAAVAASSRPATSSAEATSQRTPIASALNDAAASLALASSKSPITIRAPFSANRRGDRQSDTLRASGDDGGTSSEHVRSFHRRGSGSNWSA